MVLMTIGIVAAIAIPRVSAASERARVSALIGDLAAFQRAIDLYAAEHAERWPCHLPNRVVSPVGLAFARRLIERTDETGALNPSGLFGPYLRAIPVNSINRLATVRIDGATPGAGTHGWRFDSASGRILPDHARTAQSVVTRLEAVAPEIAPKAGGGQLEASQVEVDP